MKPKLYSLGACILALGGLAPTFLGATALNLPPSPSVQETDSVRMLDEFVIIGARRSLSTRAIKLHVPAEYIPVSVSSVKSTTWEARGITHIQDAIKFLPGAHMRTVYGAYQRLAVRGFDITPIMIDGVKDERFVPPGSSAPFPDFASIESMELLKGPASVLHGQFAAGGILNVVRKAPTSERVLNVRLMNSSYDYNQAMIDLGGPLSKSLRYRSVFNVASGEGFRYTNDRRMSGYFALAYDLAPRHKVELRGGFNRDAYGTDSGLPAVMSAEVFRSSDGSHYLSKGEMLPGLNRRSRYNNFSDRYYNRGVNLSLQYDFVASRSFNLRNYLTLTRDFMDYLSTEPLTYPTSKDAIYPYYMQSSSGARTYVDLDHVELSGVLKFANISRMLNNQLEASGAINLLGLRHNYLIGYNVVLWGRDSYSYPRAGRDNPLDPSKSLYGPGLYSIVDVHNPKSAGYIASRPGTAYPQRLSAHSLYLQNVVDLGDYFKLMLAGRYDIIRFSRTLKNDLVTDGEWGYTRTQPWRHLDNTSLTYRLGLVYLPSKQVSVYGSVANFFQPYRTFFSPNVVYINADGKRFDPSESNEVFKPQGGWQAELGSRYQLGHSLRATAALYYIKRTNETKTLGTIVEDGTNKTITGQVGSTVSKGLEVELAYTPSEHFDVSLGYTYTHATVSGIAPNDYLNVDRDEGVQQPFIPRHMLILSGRYAPRALGHRLALNWSASYTGEMSSNLSRDVLLGDYALVDMSLSYRLYSTLTLTATLNNIFDTEYATSTFGRQVIPSIGRNYSLALTYSL